MPTYKQPAARQAGKLKVVELFETVQGEGIYAGVPSVFFRTGVCNLECHGCDTKWDEWTETDVAECATKILSYRAKHVVFTGGEPTLWQPDLALLMKEIDGQQWRATKDKDNGPDARLTFTVESNGAVPITNEYLLRRVNLWSFSPKVGSLGHDEKFSHDVVVANIVKTLGKAQVKYVLDPNIPEHVDSVFEFHAKTENFGAMFMNLLEDERVFFQPYDRGTLVNIYARQVAFNPNQEYDRDLALLTKVVLERSGARFRVLPQLHKYITFR